MMDQYDIVLVLTGENGNAARRRDGQEHGGLVLAVLLGHSRLVVVEHWDEPRCNELTRLPACAHHRPRVLCTSARSSDIDAVYESYAILSIVIVVIGVVLYDTHRRYHARGSAVLQKPSIIIVISYDTKSLLSRPGQLLARSARTWASGGCR